MGRPSTAQMSRASGMSRGVGRGGGRGR
jgi:hypothetical protein